MHIELRNPVSVCVSERTFETVPAGTKVNYAMTKRDGKCVHTFTFFHRKSQGILSHITVTTDNENPPWL